MTILRVLLTRACIEAGDDCPWAVIGRDGRIERSGRGSPAQLPRMESIEALLSPDIVRVTTVRLPPLPAGRRIDAARMELGDRSIDGLEGAEIAVSDQQADGSLRVAVCDARTSSRLRALAGKARRWHTLAPLSERLSVRPDVWTWVAPDADHPGFVVTDDGTTFEVEGAAERVPPSLVLALAEADRKGRRPARIVVIGAPDGRSACLRWADSLDVSTEDGGDWSWESAAPLPSSSLQFTPAAPDDRSSQPAQPVFRAAAAVALAAAILYGLAVVGDWAHGRWRLAELAAAQHAVAQATAPELLASLTPPTAVARKLRQLRHQAGLAADDDLLPLFARTATPLAALPPGSLRGSSYSDGHVLVDLAPLGERELTRLQRELAFAGAVAVAAPTASGSRIRMTVE